MPRGGRYTPHPFIKLVSSALDELIEADGNLLAEYYLSASEKWEMPKDAFEVLLASSPRIRGCADWDVEIFWIAVVEAVNRSHPLLWLQRSTRRSQADHAIVTFSKPTPVGGRASRKRNRTTEGAAMDADRRQRALTSNRTVRSSSSSSVGQAANRVTTTMNNERCMGVRQEWQWKFRGIVEHDRDGERRDKVHEFFGDFRDP